MFGDSGEEGDSEEEQSELDELFGDAEDELFDDEGESIDNSSGRVDNKDYSNLFDTAEKKNTQKPNQVFRADTERGQQTQKMFDVLSKTFSGFEKVIKRVGKSDHFKL